MSWKSWLVKTIGKLVFFSSRSRSNFGRHFGSRGPIDFRPTYGRILKHEHVCCCPGLQSNRNGSVEPPDSVHAAIVILFGPTSPPNPYAGQPAGGPDAHRAAGGATGPPGRSNSRLSARRSIQPPRRSILPPGDSIPARRSAVAPARRRIRFRR